MNAVHYFKPEDTAFENLPENALDNPEFPILAFLSNAALESGEMQAASGQQAVQLMTVHAAKGLEFDAVFLSGLEEGRFPSELSLKEQGGLQEERRLMLCGDYTRPKTPIFDNGAAAYVARTNAIWHDFAFC